MGNGTRQDPPSGYYPQLSDKQLEEFRGLADRGLRKDARPPETLSSIYDEKSGQVFGCSDQTTLNGLVQTIDELKQLPPNGDLPNRPTIVFDRSTIRRLIIVGGSVATFHNRTPCLLRLAALMDKCLSRDLYNNFRKEFFDIVEALIDIGDEIIRRTKKPYKFFADGEANPPLDPKVLQVEPLANYQYWKTLLDVRSGKARIQDPIPLEEVQFKVDDKVGWEQTLDEIERNLEATRVDVAIRAKAVGDTPTISPYLENLKKLKFADIERQTRARFPTWWHGYSVWDHVEVIIYNSVYSALLDKNGNPLYLPGITPYSLLIPVPGEHLLRHFHPAGLYLSVGPLADYQFAVTGLKVKNLLFAGITSFTRRQSTFTFEHELQKKLQSYVQGLSIHAIAAITVPEAFGAPDLSISALKRALPGLIDETTRYALIELLKRVEHLVDNYEDILKNTTEQGIKQIIEDKIKEWCKEWLIKKIGKKFIPVINAISAIADVFDDEQTEMIRAMIGCIVMATKSKRRDDLTISAKILAKIAVDKVQEAVIQQLVQRGGRLASKVGKSAKKGKGATDDPKADHPDTPATDDPSAHADPTQAAKPTATPDAPSTTGQGQTKPMTQQQIADQLRLAQQIQHAQQQSQPQAQPKAQDQAQAQQQPHQQQQQPPSQQQPQQQPQPPAPSPQPQRWQHQQVQQQQTKRPTQDTAVTDKATDAKAVDHNGTEPAADKPGTTKKRQPDAPRRDDAPDTKATDAKATDAKVARDDDADARSTHTKDKGDRGTKPPAPTPPKEPPLPPAGMPWRERWKFYEKHKKDYPPNVQDMMDKMPKKSDQAGEVDAAIREHHAAELSKQWGIPVKTTERIQTKSAEMPPLPSKNASVEQRWKFYDKHRDDYPPHIRDTLTKMQNRNEEQAQQVELAIKEHHASQPRQETSGGDWEKTNIAERTGERPKLSAVSTTKDGAEVQIDDFDPARRVAREYKASLEIKGKDPKVAEREIQERMERHAQFAEDRDLPAYEWVAHSKDSYKKMTDALADLKGKAQKESDPDRRKKLLDRYKKISIVEEPILDK